LEHRIAHESIPLNEEKRLVKEIKELEKTRPKVVANAAKRAKMQDTVVERDAIQDQVKIIGEGLDGVKKDRQAVRSKIKVLEDELKIVDAEIAALQEDLNAATARKDKAYESLNELRKARDLNNASFHQNRNVLNRAREYSSRSEVEELKELHKSEVEKFMTEWCGNKAFREDYEKRVLISLNGRQLTRDGRMRNPDEKPIFIETHQPAPPVVQEPIPSKVPTKQAKEAAAPQTVAPKDEPLAKASAKVKAAVVDDDAYESEPAKEKAKPKEVDVAKLKEIKRQEEIEKNKLALERKKKQAEKQAAKAAARAQKEAEKKLQKEEKKAKKKTGDSDEPTDSDTKSDEAAETQVEEDLAPVSTTVNKEQKARVRSRSTVTKSKGSLPKAILKRKKAQSYWSWATTPAAAMASVAVLVALLAVLGYYQYYLPASTSN
jgi:hypothetical protein